MKAHFSLRFLRGARAMLTKARGPHSKTIAKVDAIDARPDIQLPSPTAHLAAIDTRTARYLIAGLTQVEGWLVPTTAHIMAALAEQQTRLGLGGDLAEIGVHHGKSFLVLANCVAPGEKIFAIDVFEDQHKNVDKSGLGDRQIFRDNVKAHAPGTAPEIIQESSLDLPAMGWPQSHANSIRFFAIDGSHTREATLNDLKIAEQTTKDGAIVALDDVLSSHWLGVISGLFDYLSSGGELVPFAIIPDKLLLSKGQKFKGTWIELIRKHYGPFISKRDVKLSDFAVDVVEENFSILKELEAK